MARQARSAETRAQAGRHALALGFLLRDPSRSARILEGHAPEHSAELLAALKPRQAAAILSKMTPRHAAQHLGELSPDDSTTILKQLSMVDAVAVLRSLDARRRAAILRRLPSRQSVALNWSLSHPETSVGAWADAEALVLAADLSAQDALRQVQRAAAKPGESLFVINRQRRLLGMVSVTALLRAAAESPITAVMEPAPTALQAQASLGSAASLLSWRRHNALPVVDRQQHFVGVLQRSELDRGLAQGDSESPSGNLADVLLEASDAYMAGLSALWRAGFSLLTVTRGKQNDTPANPP